MQLTEWTQIKDDCFEETSLTMDNNEVLCTIRRWDKSTVGPDVDINFDIKPMGNVRVFDSGHELYFTPTYISKNNLIRRMNDLLSCARTFKQIQELLNVYTQTICGLHDKAFMNELRGYLNDQISTK